MDKEKTKSNKNGNSDSAYFICGTIGELSISAESNGKNTFELIPDETMKVERNGRKGHLWLLCDVQSDGKCRAVVRDEELVLIEFPDSPAILSMLIAAKENCSRIRVSAKLVSSKDSSVTLCSLAIM